MSNFQQQVVPRAPTVQELQQAIEQRSVDFNTLTYFKKGWAAFKANVCQFWGTLFVYFMISAVMLFASWCGYVKAFGHPDIDMDGSGEGGDDKHHWKFDDDEDEHFMHRVPKSLLIWVAATFAFMYLFVWVPMKSSFIRASFTALRTNSKLRLADCFSSFKCPYFCRLLWLNLCFTALSSVFGPFSSGLVGFFGMFTFLLHADNDQAPLGVYKSLKFSAQAVIRHFCGILAFTFLALILNVIGFFSVIGLLITLPVTWFAFLFVYHDLIRINGFPVLVAPVQLSQITIQTAPVVTVAPGGYTQLEDNFGTTDGAC